MMAFIVRMPALAGLTGGLALQAASFKPDARDSELRRAYTAACYKSDVFCDQPGSLFSLNFSFLVAAPLID